MDLTVKCFPVYTNNIMILIYILNNISILLQSKLKTHFGNYRKIVILFCANIWHAFIMDYLMFASVLCSNNLFKIQFGNLLQYVSFISKKHI